MTRLITGAASMLAERTSRRGFLARCGQMMLALVGGSALLALMAGPAAAETQGRCRCQNPCLAWMTCSCSGDWGRGRTLEYHWHCPSCGEYQCEYYRCTTRRCR